MIVHRVAGRAASANGSVAVRDRAADSRASSTNDAEPASWQTRRISWVARSSAALSFVRGWPCRSGRLMLLGSMAVKSSPSASLGIAVAVDVPLGGIDRVEEAKTRRLLVR